MDEQLKQIYDEYKDLQATFQANHQKHEQAQQESYNPEELQRDLKQLEQEKEQLITKIKDYRSRTRKNKDFNALLKVTN